MSAPQRIPNAVDVAQASELTGLSKKALRRPKTLALVEAGDIRPIP